MKIRKTWGAVLGASALLALAACGGSSDTASEDAASEDTAEVTAGEDITIAVITHGDDGVTEGRTVGKGRHAVHGQLELNVSRGVRNFHGYKVKRSAAC